MLIENLQNILLSFIPKLPHPFTLLLFLQNICFLWLDDSIFHIQTLVSTVVSVEENMALNAQ